MSIVYTKSATARILNINPRHVLRVELWANCVFVVVKGIGARFVSKRAYHNAFVQFRKDGARRLVVSLNSSGGYLVTGGSEPHTVSADLECNCYDSAAQALAFGRSGACKHVYAVLGAMGYDSLRDYVLAENDFYCVAGN